MAERFNIIWHDGVYYVSIPNYKGGEVVDAASFDAVESTVDLLEKNAGVQAKLLADTARQRDALVKALEEEREYWAGESTSTMLLGLPDNGTIQDRIDRISRVLADVGTVGAKS